MKKWIFLYFVIIFAVLGMGIHIHQDQVTVDEVIVPGTVVDAISYQENGETTYAEVIAFELDGTKHRFTRGETFHWVPQKGRVREVAVNPDNPQQARVRTFPWMEKLISPVLRQYPVIIFLWLFGCVFFGFGWLGSMNYYEFFRRAIIIPGVVTSYTSLPGHKGGTVYQEIVSCEFGGQTRMVRARVATSRKPKMGVTREVGIDPEDTQKAYIRYGMPDEIMFAIAGLVLWALILIAPAFR